MRIFQILTLVTSIIFSSSNIFAQVTITLDSVNGQDVSGSEIILDTIPTSNISIPHLYVTNTSGVSQNWMVTRINLQQPNDWFNYLCWGDLCYGASTLNIWSSSTTSISDGDTEELSLYIGSPSAGNSHYRYYISTDGLNYLDSVDVLVNVSSTVGIVENTEGQINLFPNPAQTSITFTGVEISDYDISVVDMFGREVYKKRSLNSNNIDISMLSDGHYLFVLRNKRTNTIINKRLIIKK
ncbi:MAG: T9SS type A sorting domain-containing protein [Bacteroidales bacterium]|nr:T9SS type A sorting domain-containing protein [Bacteroidales bacterium]